MVHPGKDFYRTIYAPDCDHPSKQEGFTNEFMLHGSEKSLFLTQK